VLPLGAARSEVPEVVCQKGHSKTEEIRSQQRADQKTHTDEEIKGSPRTYAVEDT
jgi:hypothetical protein